MKKKILRVAVAVACLPIALFLLLTILLYIPPVQNWAVDTVAGYVTDNTDYNCRVGKVRLSFPLDLTIDDLALSQKAKAAQSDSLDFRMGEARASVRLWPLFSGRIVVDCLSLTAVDVATADLVASAEVKGKVGFAYLRSDGIDLTRSLAPLSDIRLDGADLSVALRDSVPEDTTSTPTMWRVTADQMTITRSKIALAMPGDSLGINVGLGRLKLTDADLDLGRGRYKVGQILYDNGAFACLMPTTVPTKRGKRTEKQPVVDLQGIHLQLDSVLYDSLCTRAVLSAMRCKERCGLTVEEAKCRVMMDTSLISVPYLTLRLSDSKIKADATVDLNVLDSLKPGHLAVHTAGRIGPADIDKILNIGAVKAMVPKDIAAGYKRLAATGVDFKGQILGNLRHARIAGVGIEQKGAFKLGASGEVSNLTDPKRLRADVELDAGLNPAVFAAFGGKGGRRTRTAARHNRAYPLSCTAKLHANGSQYATEIKALLGAGRVEANGRVNLDSKQYAATAKVTRLNMKAFMPQDSVYTLSLTAKASGQGFDFLSPKTRLTAAVDVSDLKYGHYQAGGFSLNASVGGGHGHVALESGNPLLDGTLTLDALLSRQQVAATFAADINHSDIRGLGLVDKDMLAGLCAHIDIASDLKQSHLIAGEINDLTVKTDEKVYRPADVAVSILTRKDTTFAHISAGSLAFDLDAGSGYEGILSSVDNIMDELTHQREHKIIDQGRVLRLLPTARMSLHSGEDNPFANIMRFNGYRFSDLTMTLQSSPDEGLNGDFHIYDFRSDSLRLDTIAFRIDQDEQQRVNFLARVRNAKSNPQYVFDARLSGWLYNTELGAEVAFRDDKDRLGISLGAKAEMRDSGIVCKLTPNTAVIGYTKFNINDDNYLYLGRDKRLSANLDLLTDSGTGLKVKSGERNDDYLQDITLSLSRFDLDKITSVIPYVPHITGLLGGDVRLMVDKNEKPEAVLALDVEKMTYEGCPMGDISTEFSYLMRNDSTHYVDGLLTMDDYDVVTLEGTYRTTGEGWLDARLGLDQFRLPALDGFIPDGVAALEGKASGEMEVRGPVSRPVVEGSVKFDDAYLVSVPYGVRLRMADKPVRVDASRMTFDDFALYSPDNKPLTVTGNVDFSDFDFITTDLTVKAKDYQIINAKESSKSVAYGKAFVDFGGTIKGELSQLQVRGKLDVLSSTDLTYILRDSPLNTDDQMKELVTFVNPNEKDAPQIYRPPLNGVAVLIMVNVGQGAHIRCALNADQTNYVSLEGGGELRMTYDAAEDLRLFGRYTLSSGEMKYALPVIPLKTFKIGSGSYIEFTGDMMNPKLNLTATEEVKALVAGDGGQQRSVLFDCGVKVTQTLQNLGLEFLLDATDDMTTKNELAAMSVEQRGKLAVTMLTTGMYLSDGNTSGFSMNSAMNSFLQSEINNITKSAMRSVDLSLGLDQAADAAGNMHTDYSFKFAKRFWNNRFNFVIGGKLSSNGANTNQGDETFIDNVSLEYRLDNTSMKYVRLFYNKEADDLLEDRVSQYGAGFVWRKKMMKLTDIFKKNE